MTLILSKYLGEPTLIRNCQDYRRAMSAPTLKRCSSRRIACNLVIPEKATQLPLQYLRAEFAVANTGANFHLHSDCCDRSDNCSVLIRRDAVAASQRRVRPEHT